MVGLVIRGGLSLYIQEYWCWVFFFFLSWASFWYISIGGWCCGGWCLAGWYAFSIFSFTPLTTHYCTNPCVSHHYLCQIRVYHHYLISCAFLMILYTHLTPIVKSIENLALVFIDFDSKSNVIDAFSTTLASFFNRFHLMGVFCMRSAFLIGACQSLIAALVWAALKNHSR